MLEDDLRTIADLLTRQMNTYFGQDSVAASKLLNAVNIELLRVQQMRTHNERLHIHRERLGFRDAS